MPDKDTQFYLKELMSEECACGKPKKPRYSFCYRCYSELPRTLKNRLYDYVGDGYEQAYDESIEYLEINIW